MDAAAAIDLALNLSKCELVLAAGDASEVDVAQFPVGVPVLRCQCVKFLGVPIGSREFCEAKAARRVAKAAACMDAVAELADPRCR